MNLPICSISPYAAFPEKVAWPSHAFQHVAEVDAKTDWLVPLVCVVSRGRSSHTNFERVQIHEFSCSSLHPQPKSNHIHISCVYQRLLFAGLHCTSGELACRALLHLLYPFGRIVGNHQIGPFTINEIVIANLLQDFPVSCKSLFRPRNCSYNAYSISHCSKLKVLSQTPRQHFCLRFKVCQREEIGVASKRAKE